ncbi:arylsulfatase I [Danio rerio]|uniref:Arylsulfatase I n=1 Tax=Danio rerio TaxID=7955 RepID=A0A2R8QMU9_DANRE|nr:arylsulfatase I [Danio rerio]|eukprot:XP_692237.2 arylsulfatase I [Danio rerio]
MALLVLLILSLPACASMRTNREDFEGFRVEEKPEAAAFKPKQPPHIIFILTDDQGFNDIGYHSGEIRSPTLDKLASEGVRLENYYVQPLCTPSRSQLITGRYQIHTGLQHSIIRPRQPNCLPLDVVTLPQRLQEIGYSTHMVGKWHLGFYRKDCLPTRRGFHTYFGSLTGSVDYYTYGSCDGKSLCGFDLHEGESVAWGRAGKYSTHLYTQRVRKILATHDPTSQPLFIFLSLQAVHTPLKPPKEYIYPYRNIGNVPRRKYAAMVSIVDEAVRNITYALRKYGFYRNSVVIFSTDNGAQPLTGGSNWPLRGCKGTYWEGGIRGVGFVHSPLIRHRRRISRDLIHITDWYPTLVGLAGGNVSQHQGLDGFDVWPTISEGKESPRLEILHNIDPLNRRSRGSLKDGYGLWDTTVQAAIRVGDWKLLTGDPGNGDWVPPHVLTHFPSSWWHLERDIGEKRKSVWLFNVTGDPCERHDLAVHRPDVVRELLARLAFHNRTAIPVRYPPDDTRANPSANGGAWRPWVGEDDEEENWDGVYYKRGKNRKRKKCRLCKLQSFFKKFNLKIMSKQI